MIKRRNLDPSLMGWLMNVTGLGPGIGDVHYLVGATSEYYSWLRDDLKQEPSKIHFTLQDGEDALTSGRNDVLLVYPMALDVDTEVDWDKSNTHMIGLGGPNVGGDWSEPNVVLYSDNVATVQILDISGHNCIFKNLNIENYGANAACLFAVKLNGYGNWFEDCGIKGTMTSAQCGVAGAGSLQIAGAGMYPVFKNCQIGQDVWGTRTTANSGVIEFNSSARPNGGDFINCRILSVGDDANCAMVRVASATSIGRGWRFDNTIFSHFDGNASGVTDLARVFYTPSTAVQREIIHLHNCMVIGADEWQTDDDNVVVSDMPACSTSGGIAINPTSD